jgi:hypothetical protein
MRITNVERASRPVHRSVGPGDPTYGARKVDLLEGFVVLRFVENGQPGIASVQGVINPTRFVCTFWPSDLGMLSEFNSPEKSPDTFFQCYLRFRSANACARSILSRDWEVLPR